ncbi:hypothetical protein [Sphingomonas sp. CROZ-RG-20F-R02-07]|uniref:hypothetical protein n=1 Tax=Sphingomonas sp. CROZ-RG-20F-R02-07 TaxID=2914832 RepID=UPI001F583196|nr:hypothetical protein [Sphingomonas sp. CROZ-RG-20F-R02-07]
MKRNLGKLPKAAIGKRVRGILASGSHFGGTDGWAADGRAGCRWELIGDPFDIEFYEVIA